MSIETYETLNDKHELYRLLDEGRAAVKSGRKRPLEDVMRDIRRGSSLLSAEADNLLHGGWLFVGLSVDLVD